MHWRDVWRFTTLLFCFFHVDLVDREWVGKAWAEDNSRFYGSFGGTMAVGSCAPKRISIVIGDDFNRKDEDNYLYLPSSGAVICYSGLKNSSYVRVIKVSGDTISLKDLGTCSNASAPCRTLETVASFFENYNRVQYDGIYHDEDPSRCQGVVNGSAMKSNPTYDATGEWEVVLRNSAAQPDCDTVDEGSEIVMVTQNGNNVTLIDEDGDTFRGTVDARNYYLSGLFVEHGDLRDGDVTFSLSSSTSGDGTVSWSSTDGCEGSFDFSVSEKTVEALGAGSGGGGGGGGGCFLGSATSCFGW
jgi:hypothetical protein